MEMKTKLLQLSRQKKQTLKQTVREEKEYYIITKGSFQKEGITCINIYARNIAPKYMKQISSDITGEVDQQHSTSRKF